MHEICELFLQSASSFNTEGKTFVKKSLHCITQGISTKIFQTIRRCNIFQRMIAETLQSCDEQTVSANQPCSADSAGASAFNNPSSWKNTPVFNIQPGFRGRDPTHLFARKRSVDDMEGGVNAAVMSGPSMAPLSHLSLQ
ncbi:hypothetical protein F7725_014965, partial [Dissostichus mawsoni]